MAVASTRPKTCAYRVPDFRPAPDYAPLLPSAHSKWDGFFAGATMVADLLAPFHATRPWLSTPWRDRAYLAHDWWRASEQLRAAYPNRPDLPAYPVQERLFDPDHVDGVAPKQ